MYTGFDDTAVCPTAHGDLPGDPHLRAGPDGDERDPHGHGRPGARGDGDDPLQPDGRRLRRLGPAPVRRRPGAGEAPEWTNAKAFEATDGFGALHRIKITDDTKRVGFIVHQRPPGNPDIKDTDPDRFFIPLATPEIWLRQGDTRIFSCAQANENCVVPLGLSGARSLQAARGEHRGRGAAHPLGADRHLVVAARAALRRDAAASRPCRPRSACAAWCARPCRCA